MDTEPNFNEDVEEQQQAVSRALNELTKIKAYTLAEDELRDFKLAQYALRNLSEEHSTSTNLPDVQEEYS